MGCKLSHADVFETRQVVDCAHPQVPGSNFCTTCGRAPHQRTHEESTIRHGIMCFTGDGLWRVQTNIPDVGDPGDFIGVQKAGGGYFYGCGFLTHQGPDDALKLPPLGKKKLMIEEQAMRHHWGKVLLFLFLDTSC